MRLTAENKERVRKRILSGAAQLFRQRGYNNVNLDHVMEAADLTRGAFYAHFKSKAELLADVARHEHPLLRMLKARDGSNADELWAQMHTIFEGYLEAENLEEVFQGCTLAALTGDASRAPDDVKRGFEAAWLDVCNELARGQAVNDRAALEAALLLAVSAVSTATANDDYASKQRILNSARAGFSALTQLALT